MESFRLTARQVEANRLLAGPQTHTLLRGGSRSGKTFLLLRAIIIRAARAPETNHAVFRYRLNHVRASVWKGTLPVVRRLCFPHLAVETNETDLEMRLSNGSRVVLGGLDDKARVEKILGQEYSSIFFNEISQIPYPSVGVALSRLAQKSALRLRAYYDCNPPGKSHWSHQLFREGINPGTRERVASPADYAEMRLNPADNRENLNEAYFDILAGMNARQRRRFEAGEWASDIAGALWKLEAIDRDRIAPAGADELALRRIVVAVDPPASSGPDADECGIVVAGVGRDGDFYVLADRSCQGRTPDGWAREAVRAYREFSADRVVAEVNNGGDMVEAVLRQVDPKVSYKAVRASRGKVTRAEPVSALYEQGRVHHCGVLAALEDQMCEFTADFDRQQMGYSPDRVDALVWALTELAGGGKFFGVIL